MSAESREKRPEIVPFFRKFPEGDIVAIWYVGASSNTGYMSYQHVGQHGEIDPTLIHELEQASLTESEPLIAELRFRGYDVVCIGMGG